MVSVETSKKLQEEIISLIGDHLLEDDEPFLNLLSNSKDSKGVLELATELKEAGISLFKKGEMDDALEKYGYALVILARYQFEKECDRLEFLKLAISSLMNSVLCFSKKKEFVQVGKICSIVLDFDPYNVKAMYRRALAAIELGKRDWAKLDLWMALDIDPNNKEVLKKLDELKDTPSKENGVIPNGLGLGLSPPKKKKNEGMDQRMSKLQGVQVNDSCKNDEKGGEIVITGTKQEKDEEELQGRASSTIEPEEVKGELVDDIMERSNEVFHNDIREDKSSLSEEENKLSSACTNDDIKSEKMDDADSSTITDDGAMLSKFCNEEKTFSDQSSTSCLTEECVTSVKNDSLNLAESKYRFHNQKRKGSCLAISQKDYNVLVQGKTIKCFNRQQGSFMEIRIKKSHENFLTKSKDHALEGQEKTDLDMSDIQSNLDEEVQDNSDIMQAAAVQTRENQASCVEVNYSSPSSEGSHFIFSASPKPKTRRRRFDVTTYSSSKQQVKSIKRRKMPTRDNILSPNTADGCRFGYNRKRKGTHSPLGLNHHPAKKLATHTQICSCTSECSCSYIHGCSISFSLRSSESNVNLVKLCTNNGLELQGCLQEDVDSLVNEARAN